MRRSKLWFSLLFIACASKRIRARSTRANVGLFIMDGARLWGPELGSIVTSILSLWSSVCVCVCVSVFNAIPVNCLFFFFSNFSLDSHLVYCVVVFSSAHTHKAHARKTQFSLFTWIISNTNQQQNVICWMGEFKFVSFSFISAFFFSLLISTFLSSNKRLWHASHVVCVL